MSKDVQFQYNHTEGNKWAEGFIGSDINQFEFFCSYLFNDPLEQILTAIYQITPNLATYPRKEIQFMLLDEPLEFIWNFKVIDEKNISLRVFEKRSNSIATFEDEYEIESLILAIIQWINHNPNLLVNEKIQHIYRKFKIYLRNINS